MQYIDGSIGEWILHIVSSVIKIFRKRIYDENVVWVFLILLNTVTIRLVLIQMLHKSMTYYCPLIVFTKQLSFYQLYLLPQILDFIGLSFVYPTKES